MEEALTGRIGRYALLSRVGRGGMGEVHRARAFGAAGVTKELCIKRIRCERLADPASLGRFVAEARVSMGLSHANIVSVFDFGRSENDYYLAMEWVDGCDLRRLLAAVAERGERLPEDVALFVAAEVARGLAYVHGLPDDRRVAHCDLKPANVLVSRAGEVKLADFGVAVAEASAALGGTRRYMAPEQRDGDAVGIAVDLYALGVLLDELCGGTFARRDDDDARAYAPPEGVTSAVGALLVQLCASDPAARPASAAAVVDALEALLAEARVRDRRSPRDLLAREARAVAPSSESGDEPGLDFRTDASFVTEGESETFARRMRPDASPRTQTRSTPVPPRPPAPPWTPRVLAMALVVALAALGLQHALVPAEQAAPAPSPTNVAPRTAPSQPALLPSAPAAAPEPLAPPEPAPPTHRDPVRAVAPRATPAAPETTTAPSAAPAVPAVLRINARPWAEVTIDGTARGVTPLVAVELPPGPHDVTFTNGPLDAARTEHVELAPGEHRDLIVDLR